MAIKTLWAHTVRSNKRWMGHPSIPPRVFRLAKYLDKPPKQLTKPQPTVTPRLDTSSLGFNEQLPSSRTNFQPTRPGSSLYGPQEQSLGQSFAQWFDSTFVDYSPEVRLRAIKAGWEATCHTLFKMPVQHRGLPGPDWGQPPADLVYSPETQDIRYRTE